MCMLCSTVFSICIHVLLNEYIVSRCIQYQYNSYPVQSLDIEESPREGSHCEQLSPYITEIRPMLLVSLPFSLIYQIKLNLHYLEECPLVT